MRRPISVIFICLLIIAQTPQLKRVHAEDLYSENFRERLCSRVIRRFAGNPKAWLRVNNRIERRLGYRCNIQNEKTSCEGEGGNYLEYPQINWARCDCPESLLFDTQLGKCIEREQKCTRDKGTWIVGSDECWNYDTMQCVQTKGCKIVAVSDGHWGEVFEHCEPTNYCACPENKISGNSGCKDLGHPSIIGVPEYLRRNN
ncbi:MAG: hypothetical protein K9M03_04165 [Kiritimatiellales bacterium]|nr:hypothetical protein [Kiritimatiellales bacterium]